MKRAALVLAVLLFSREALAEEKFLVEAFALFRKGAYSQAIEKAKAVQAKDQAARASVAFFLATTYAKMQSFDKAVAHYAEAEKLGSDAPNLFYDYGQALFATQKLREAETYFKKSIVANFKVAASAYYVGFIRQTLEDRAGAADFYQRIQRLRSDPDQVKQPALYQIAELAMDEVNEKNLPKEERLRALDKNVLPLYRQARDYKSGTATAEEAERKISAIDAELATLVERMRNGVPIPKQPYSFHLTQEFGYDSNVITQADEAITEVSHKSAFLSKTSLLTKYQFNFQRTWSVTPELSTYAQFHSRRSVPRVFQNDNVVVAPAVRTKYEHTSRGQPATMLLDVEYNLMLRDYEQQHHYPFYSRYLNFVLGERVKWWDTGTTTVKLGIKFFESYDPARNSYSPQLSLQQVFKIFGKYDLQNTLTADYLHARDDVNDERNYKLRTNTTIQKFFEKVDFTPSLSFTLKDTLKQKGTRGNELLVNPSLGFSRQFGRNIEGNLEYAYSKNYSEDKVNYHYTKHEAKLSATARF